MKISLRKDLSVFLCISFFYPFLLQLNTQQEAIEGKRGLCWLAVFWDHSITMGKTWQQMTGAGGLLVCCINTQEEERVNGKGETSYKASRSTPCDPLSLERLRLVKVPHPSQMVPPIEDDIFTHKGLWVYFTLKSQHPQTENKAVQIMAPLCRGLDRHGPIPL